MTREQPLGQLLKINSVAKLWSVLPPFSTNTSGSTWCLFCVFSRRKNNAEGDKRSHFEDLVLHLWSTSHDRLLLRGAGEQPCPPESTSALRSGGRGRWGEEGGADEVRKAHTGAALRGPGMIFLYPLSSQGCGLCPVGETSKIS